MNGNGAKALKAAAGIAVLLVLALTVRGWWGDYRQGVRTTRDAPETTASVEATSPIDAEGEGDSGETAEPAPDNTVVVLIDGLNFRSAPKDDAKPLRGLDKGERLELLGERDGWYEVRDEDGATGWVSSNPSYTKTDRR